MASNKMFRNSMVLLYKRLDVNLYEYLKFVLEQRPSKTMTDRELANLAPWSEIIQQLCKDKME